MIQPVFRTQRKNATSTSQSSAISCIFFNNVSFRLLSWLLLLLRMLTISAAKLDFEFFKIKLRRRIFLLCIFQGNFTFGIEKESFEIHFLESVLAPSTSCSRLSKRLSIQCQKERLLPPVRFPTIGEGCISGVHCLLELCTIEGTKSGSLGKS